MVTLLIVLLALTISILVLLGIIALPVLIVAGRIVLAYFLIRLALYLINGHWSGEGS